jgi:acetyl-CoA carboxylase carboxyl transferase subunit alpha
VARSRWRWKTPERTADAAESLGITAGRLKSLGLIDQIIPEPVGGAHRDPGAVMQSLRKSLHEQLKVLDALSPEDLIKRRHDRLMSYGRYKEISLA